MSPRIQIQWEAMKAFCQQWQITELALFGSVLTDAFTPDSDVDVLVSFDPAARHSLFDLVQMQDELGQIFARKVDLVSRRGLEASRNPWRKKAILQSAETVYAS